MGHWEELSDRVAHCEAEGEPVVLVESDAFPLKSLVRVTLWEAVRVAMEGDGAPEGDTVPEYVPLAEMHRVGVKDERRRVAKAVVDTVSVKVREALGERVKTREGLKMGVRVGERVAEVLEEAEGQLEGVGENPPLAL